MKIVAVAVVFGIAAFFFKEELFSIVLAPKEDGFVTYQLLNRMSALVGSAVEPFSAIHFLPGATQANFIVHAAALSPIQSVICPDSGHVYAHEAGSIENTGHKLVPLPSTGGKISAEQIRKAAASYYNGGEPNYICEPKMVYISFPTEWGTIYSEQELKEIRKVCDEYEMYLFVDGARLGYGLGSVKNDLTLEKLAELTDVFYIGGTKCGALFGEALVITNKKLARKFRTYMKQNGAVLAKGWLLGHAVLCPVRG